MKGLLKAIVVLLGIIAAICELLEFLFLPTLFVLIGVLNQLPWQYYAITVGGYFAVVIMLELILGLIFKKLERKHSTRFARKLKKIISRFTRENENSQNLPTEDN